MEASQREARVISRRVTLLELVQEANSEGADASHSAMQSNATEADQNTYANASNKPQQLESPENELTERVRSEAKMLEDPIGLGLGIGEFALALVRGGVLHTASWHTIARTIRESRNSGEFTDPSLVALAASELQRWNDEATGGVNAALGVSDALVEECSVAISAILATQVDGSNKFTILFEQLASAMQARLGPHAFCGRSELAVVFAMNVHRRGSQEMRADARDLAEMLVRLYDDGSASSAGIQDATQAARQLVHGQHDTVAPSQPASARASNAPNPSASSGYHIHKESHDSNALDTASVRIDETAESPTADSLHALALELSPYASVKSCHALLKKRYTVKQHSKLHLRGRRKQWLSRCFCGSSDSENKRPVSSNVERCATETASLAIEANNREACPRVHVCDVHFALAQVHAQTNGVTSTDLHLILHGKPQEIQVELSMRDKAMFVEVLLALNAAFYICESESQVDDTEADKFPQHEKVFVT